MDQQGNLYAADPLNCRVQKFDPNGKFLAKYGSCGTADGQYDFNGPWGVAVDWSGNIYATGGTTLQKFDSAGRFLEKWMLPGNDRAIAVDQQGSIYLETGEAEFLRKFRQR